MSRVRFIGAALLTTLISLPLPAAFNPETGVPLFTIYGPDQYNASPQNWAIAEDRRGVMYFGNTDGVLEFDGLSWRTIRLTNGSIVRSLAVDERGTVFAGGEGVFGMLQPDRKGAMQFVSLLDKVPEDDRKFLDIWRILPTPSGVYFSSYARLFRLNRDGSLRVWRPASNFGRAFYVRNALYVKTPEHGLMTMDRDTLAEIPGGELFAKTGPTDAVTLGRDAMIATPTRLFRLNEAGVHPFPVKAEPWFETNLLYTMHVTADGEIAAGTRNGGVVILSPTGSIDRVIAKADGLPDNYVVSIYEDRQGGVWLAGGNGIARFNPGISTLPERLGLGSNTISMARQSGYLFVGTASGLFRMESAPGQLPRFERIAGIETSVHVLQPRPDGLLAATENGIYQISGRQATRTIPNPAVFMDVSSSARDPAAAYSAGQAGVFMLRRSGSQWAKTGQFSPPALEFRTLLEDPDGRVWATTRDAIWRIDFRQTPPRAEQFGEAQGVPVVPGGWISVRRLQGHITFATSKGLRRYSEATRRFEPDLTLGKDFADGSRDVFDFVEAPNGDVGVTGDKYHGLLIKQQQGGFHWLPMPLQSAGIGEVYQAAMDPDGIAWMTGAKGVLIRLDRSLFGNPDKDFTALTRRIQVIGQKDSLYGGAGPFNPSPLAWRNNNLHFEFAAPFHEDPKSVEFQWRLEGSDEDWSAWSHQSARDYTHLPEGGYKFRVRARTPHGTVSEQPALSLEVLPPWYRTLWAYAIYLVFGGFGVTGIVHLRTRQLEADKKHLENIVEERTVEIRQQRDEIHEQERKGHALLLNILPATVADELQSTGAVEPVGFDDVTVCFTDFVGFTLSSEKLAPGKLVDALNEYFTAFDEIIVHHKLEKLKTIGDSYMFVSGLPVRRASHAVDAVLAALEMVEVVKRLAAKTDGVGWNIRVGLHSGPVVAGVVGTLKFAFDIWGNTVNFAARMESSGVHGRVNMSERTNQLVRNLIDCEARGHVKIKEGRDLLMFLAQGPAEDFAERYRQEFGTEAPGGPVPAAQAVSA